MLSVYLSRGWAFIVLSAFYVLVSSAPTHLKARQAWTGTSSRELTLYGCRPVIFIYARETIAPGNLGFWVGPEISNRLKLYFGVENVATEGVDYLGLIDTNFSLGGASPVAIGLMQALITKAVVQCPTSKVIAAGYSQGAAIAHRAVQYLDQAIKDRITAVVTFGDTQTLQDGGRIIGYPIDKTLIICNVGDVICTGTLWVFPVHFDYTKRVPEAVHWIIWKILSSYFNPPITPWYWGFPGVPPPSNDTESAVPTATEVGSADPALGTMTMPDTSFFPSIPVGDAAPTVTVDSGSAPTEVDVGDVLSDFPELSSLITAIPGAVETGGSSTTAQPPVETSRGECELLMERERERERERADRRRGFSFFDWLG
ncbi:uncharacterized protein DNG_05943 [Cephalotrichum gorgonifer]|uniref:cutinase n=1 Tax=Cephalotrichum gorgonifer TaxID=2041049 RepID=A0AAE8MYS1_9PEZI|nr:uncharacterized protein DNG_05943 [Cephalotrichum gorgonifer]